MGKNVAAMYRRLILISLVFCLSILGSLSIPTIASADDPDAVCVLNVVAEGNVFSILVNQPQGINIAVPLPIGTDVSAPIPCSDVESLGVAVANQTGVNVNVAVQILAHDGKSVICSKGPFIVSVNGGRGFTFTDCQ